MPSTLITVRSFNVTPTTVVIYAVPQFVPDAPDTTAYLYPVDPATVTQPLTVTAKSFNATPTTVVIGSVPNQVLGAGSTTVRLRSFTLGPTAVTVALAGVSTAGTVGTTAYSLSSVLSGVSTSGTVGTVVYSA